MVHFRVTGVKISEFITREQFFAANPNSLYADAMGPINLNTHHPLFQYIKHGNVHLNLQNYKSVVWIDNYLWQ